MPEFRNRNYARDTRKKFAEIANRILEKHGQEVRYDERSYRDMGLDIEPMKHVSRIAADKGKVLDYAVMDAEWTRRMIEAEMQIAAIERDKTYVKLKEVEKRLSAVSNDIRKLGDANAKLPRGMKLSPLSRMTVITAKMITRRMLEIERERISQRFADETAARTIQHMLDATAPVSAHRGGKPRKVQPMPGGKTPPSPEALAVLHASAKEEMRLHRISMSGRARRLAGMATGALAQWREQAQPKPIEQEPLGGVSTKSGATTGPKKVEGIARQEPPFVAAAPKGRGTATPTPTPKMGMTGSSPEQAATKRMPPKFYMTPPKNVLEMLERMGVARFPQSAHDYVNAQVAAVTRGFGAAAQEGPAALEAMLNRIREQTSAKRAKLDAKARGEERARAPITEAAPKPEPAEPTARERGHGAGNDGTAETRATERGGYAMGGEARSRPEDLDADARPTTDEPADGRIDNPALVAGSAGGVAERTSAAENAVGAGPTGLSREAKGASEATEAKSPTGDAKRVGPDESQSPRAAGREPTAYQADMDIEALMARRDGGGSGKGTQTAKKLKPSDYRREAGSLRKDVSEPKSKMEMGFGEMPGSGVLSARAAAANAKREAETEAARIAAGEAAEKTPEATTGAGACRRTKAQSAKRKAQSAKRAGSLFWLNAEGALNANRSYSPTWQRFDGRCHASC